MRRSFIGTLCFLVFAFSFVACGGGGSSAPLSSIAVTPATPSITVAADEQFTATGTYSDGSTADITTSVTWSSSDTAVATVVSTSGLATAVAAGTATITATSGSVSGNTLTTVTAQNLIDVHAHASIDGVGASALGLVDMLTSNGVSTTILMMVPTVEYQDPDTSTAEMLTFFTDYRASFRFMYGGSELNPFLYAVGCNDLPITPEKLYPNGGAPATIIADIVKLYQIHDTPAAYVAEFLGRATTAAETGNYVGFGELAPLHESSRSGQPYITYNVDTQWMLGLSDIAALNNMFLDVHVEATTTTLMQLATLLSYNPNTKIIWDHAGWSNLDTSLATAEVFSQMLADHANLYLNLKMRSSQEGDDTSPVNSDGIIKSEWLTLLTTYADRIMVGTDAKYWSDPSSTVEADFESSYSSLNAMLEQLPSATAVKIREGTARTLFSLP